MFEAQLVVAIQSVFLVSILGEWTAIFLARVLIFAYVPLLLWIWVYGHKAQQHIAKEAVWAAGLAILIGESLSLLVLRVRPFLFWDNIIVLIPPPLTGSWPSIHTATALAMTTALFMINKKLGWFGLLLAAGVALGRVAAGVHYPTDILSGALIGFLAYCLVRLGHNALKKIRV